MQPHDVIARPLVTSRYELLTALASGGMATVYIGLQKGTGSFQRTVAIKRLHEHIVRDPSISAMFQDEAQIASLIQHPNVVAIHDVYLQAGEQLLVMEYVDGVSLGQLRKAIKQAGQAIPTRVGVRIVIDALRGLHAAHELKDMDGRPLSVVHRDATPHNILLSADGQVKVADFGIARATERSGSTQTGQVKGKFAYMAPEQVAGREMDRRVDVFAMGAVLWEILANRRMFRGDHDAVLIAQIASGQYQRPGEVRPGIPPALEAIVMKATSFRPEDRYATAAAFADALEHHARTVGGLASANDVAAVVAQACGAQIQARRHQIHEILGGRAPRVSWLEPRIAPAASETSGYAPHGSNAAVASLVVDPPTTPSGSRQHARRNAAWIAAGGVAFVGIAVVLAMVLRAPAGETTQAAAPSASPGVTPSGSEQARAPERVSVRIEADDDIVELRAPASADLELGGRQATFTTLKGEAGIVVYARLADGTELRETIVPNANAVIKLRKATGGGKKPAVGAGTRPPGAGPAPGPVPKYENNPYE